MREEGGDICVPRDFALSIGSYNAPKLWKNLRGNVKKKNSIFVDIVQIEVDLPPSYLIFDILLIMLTSLPPLEFLTKIIKF